MGHQRIYSWLPQNGNELELIYDDGAGTIDSISFDDHANNLYWINPLNHVIMVMNLNSCKKAKVYKGNSACLPLKLTLNPENG